MRKEIVALILEKDGKILVEKRKSSKATVPGSVIFPAGHVEENETREEALIREMKEELGINIYELFLIYRADFDCEENQTIYWYSCASWTGEIANNEAEELLWITDPSILTHEISREALNKYFESKN